MYEASSINGRRRREDETYDHYCQQCGVYLGNTAVNAQAFLCELCIRAENGEAIPAETIRLYRATHQKPGGVSLVVLEQPDDPRTAESFSLTTFGARILKAIGSPLRTKKPPATASVELSKEKQRPRVFQSVDLGSIDRLDEKLRGPK